MCSRDRLRDICNSVISNCTECNLCISECQLLKIIGEEPTAIAERGPTVEEAYACFLCGLCEQVCPSSVGVKKMFMHTREHAVQNNEIDIQDYRYMFPDRPTTVMSLFREVNGISYHDLCTDQANPIGFFPGCSMLTYSPELTRELYHQLRAVYPKLTLLTDCCGLPLYQLGLQERGESFTEKLNKKFKDLGLSTVILACPNCYYQMRSTFQEDSSLAFMTVYEALENTEIFQTENGTNKIVTVHDSCPDREAGIYARQVRNALVKKGYQILEMEHHHAQTLCCGSGGQVSHSVPDLAQSLGLKRVKEAEDTRAEILTGYCVGCVLNFSKYTNMKTKHALNLLLDIDQDFSGVKAKAKQILDGPKGIKYWEKIMAD